MNKKMWIIAVMIACALVAGTAFYSVNLGQPALSPTGPLDFTVAGSNDCLRFLNSSVKVVYVPFTLDANQNWQLTINATKMPGGANAWVDIYVYDDYWDNGADNICQAGDIYTILPDIQSTDFALKASEPYTQTFQDTAKHSYTIFFVLPPGGQSEFQITLQQA
ncbi:MAG: hypothetical protein NWF01_03305 [Candidatus Bathyarchaeota archaeon]|nr:hypothetical protein [Candidatus Bathyarchaeota archaeon]